MRCTCNQGLNPPPKPGTIFGKTRPLHVSAFLVITSLKMAHAIVAETSDKLSSINVVSTENDLVIHVNNHESLKSFL